MKVGWLMDDPGYVGGAELSAAEFREAVPEGVEIIDCLPGAVISGLSRYIAHNVCRYVLSDMQQINGPTVWYHHDLSPHVDPAVREKLNRGTHIFCSAFQRDKYGAEGATIPPAMKLDGFRPSRQVRRNGKREGICSIGQWRGPGKGAALLFKWSQENGPVDVYGVGDYQPVGENINNKGPLAPSAVAHTLWGYKTFVFLPIAPEPFCRSIAEAHAAGCEVITNRLVGAREWLDKPERIESAADDFWKEVLR